MKNLFLAALLISVFSNSAISSEETLKESLEQFAGSYTVEACYGKGTFAKEEDEIDIAVEKAEFEKAYLLKIGNGLAYKFSQLKNTVITPRQKMSNTCLSSISSWIVDDNFFAAKTAIQHFDKTFCKLEKKKKTQSHSLTLKNYGGFLILDHEEIVGGKTIQSLSCKLVK